jgi:glycosyltransferase involved in cell wall biosynthesis/SAM-dependent methyltransferase
LTPAIEQTLAARRVYYDRIDWRAVEPYQLEVQRDLIALLPENVDSILDVGCGNGYISNALAGRYTVVGVDISAVALRHLKVPGCLASVAQLPCANDAFDLVIASEVIEHLPPGEFDVALHEIQRVARRYIITSVPFAEDLTAGRRYSVEVGALRHMNDHMRSFDLPTMMSLYREFELDSVVFTGVGWERESRPIEAFKALMTELDAAPLADNPAETVLSQDQAAEILRLLRTDQARALGRAPELVDFCRLRSEIIGLYRRRPTSGEKGKVNHTIRRGAEVAAALPVREVDLNVIDFRQLDRHRQPWIRTMEPFPYVVTAAAAVATPQGTRFSACEAGASFDLKIGFFCDLEEKSRLEIAGVAEAETTLSIAHYGADNWYRHLATRSVAGPFRMAVDDAEFSHSQYGVLFCITVTGGGLTLEAARIAVPKPTRRAIYTKPVEYLRGDSAEVDCFLSCAYYGRDVPVLKWFKDTRQVRSRSNPGGLNPYDIAVQTAAVANIALKSRTQLTGCAAAIDESGIHDRHEFASLQQQLAQSAGRLEAIEESSARDQERLASLQQQLMQSTERVETLEASRICGQERLASLQQEVQQGARRIEEALKDLSGRIEVLAAGGISDQERLASLRRQMAQRVATLTGELQEHRHDARLRRGALGLMREMLNINACIGFDGRPKTGIRVPLAARIYFRLRDTALARPLRRARERLIGGGTIGQVGAESPSDGAPPGRTVTMIVPDDRIDRRVLLSGRSLSEAGWNVTVVAAPYPTPIDQDQIEFPELHIVRADTSVAAVVPPEALPGNRRHSEGWREVYFYHFNFLDVALRHPARVYVANDLPVLPAAAVAAAQIGAVLVYDAHELFPEIVYHSAEQQALFREAEADLIKDAALVTTINESIAEEMARRYEIALPAVILNAPAAMPASGGSARNGTLRRERRIPAEMRILLYQGGLGPYRNLEDLVAAMAVVRSEDIVLVMMGPDTGLRDVLEAIARDTRTLGQRVLFRDPVPQQELLVYTAAADVGIVPYPAVDLNTRYCTPNKLFEYIAAGVPILANDLPELRKFVLDNGFGQVYPFEGSAAIATAIDAMFLCDLQPYRDRLAARREEFTWEAQGKKLVALYGPLAMRQAGQTQLAECSGVPAGDAASPMPH